MKNKKGLSEDEFRQKVDGFSIDPANDEMGETGYKIVDYPLYQTHSLDYDKKRDDKENKGSEGV